MRSLVFLFIILVPFCTAAPAGEPFFKAGDVIAYVGGEDMVVAAELGYLETLIQLALPEHRLKFRSLAREGDTVFEQRRDLNYPSLEAQLDKMGATVVICQFGQMESLAAGAPVDGMDRMDAMDKVDATKGASAVQEVHKVQAVHEKADAARKAKVAEFVAAYEGLIGRFSKNQRGEKRRVVLIVPRKVGQSASLLGNRQEQGLIHLWSTTAKATIQAFADAGYRLGNTLGVPTVDLSGLDISDGQIQTDGIHLTTSAHLFAAMATTDGLHLPQTYIEGLSSTSPKAAVEFRKGEATLRQSITAKNRLWFHYYRPQNWAFLAGDRTNQPSSRDHLDPSKRWFPEELEKFVPLIDAKDAEIWALAKKLSALGGK